MHHQLGAGIAPRTVIGVRIAGVEGEVIVGFRVHLPGRDGVEALGRLAITLALLRAEIARPAADRIGLEERELAVAVLLPDLHFGFFLEDTDKDWRFLVHVLLGKRR